ncbi:MAG: hypothetical protein KC423_27960, partial [Anaerolineales bacterium]|nr:hypothetical protein [Anaerolineales bacterium]
EGPHFMECVTYRFRAHSMFDAELYRQKTEVSEWRQRDPINQLMAQIKADGTLTDADLATMEREIAQEMDEAVAFAEAGSWEPLADLTRFVYSEN